MKMCRRIFLEKIRVLLTLGGRGLKSNRHAIINTMKQRIRFPLGLAIFAGGSLVTPAWAATTTTLLYSTGFDSSEGYSAGDIKGQQGWSTDQPGNGLNYANVTLGAPAGYSGTGALEFKTGHNVHTSPRYAWNVGYGATFTSEIALGAFGLVTNISMYMASGQTSVARMGLVNYDVTGLKVLSGYYVQASTHEVYLYGYSDVGGTFENNSIPTGATLANDQWTDFTTIWDRNTGRFTVSWGANSFFMDGAGAGLIPDETDFYGVRFGSTIGTTSYFDNFVVSAEGVSAVPEVTSTFSTIVFVSSGLLLRRRAKALR